MSRSVRHASSASFGRVALAALAAVALPAAADDWPALRQGLWELQRTLGTQKVTAKKCMDPVADLRRQNAALERNGCTFAPIRRSGSTYTFESTCDMKTPGGNIRSASVSVMTVESDSAYRLEVHGTLAGEPTHETMTARRAGDCKP
ncbi:MAG: DUF3617 domain-containing protein [Gammaproteobacteria bacterium]|jgi:hypothetical protein|nr:DUF3617 domain-containing protein [Gammaproteobacteria bacterium]